MFTNRDSQFNFNLTTKLIEEVQRQGREYLYDLSHKSYRNTCLKQNTWQEIGKEIGVSVVDAQKKWRALRSKYMQLAKQAKSGSAAELKSKEKWIVRALDFLKVHLINEPTVSSLPLNYQELFDNTAEDINSINMIIEETENASEQTENAVEITALAEASATPVAGPSNYKLRRGEAAKRQKVSHAVPIDSKTTYICDTIKDHQEVLRKLEPNDVPKEAPCKCLMQVFANIWSEDVAKWPRSEQADHSALITRLTVEKNNQLNIPVEEPFEFSITNTMF